MPTPVLAAVDGPRVTVNELIRDPLLIPARILDVSKQSFLGEVLLRNAGQNDSGLVEYFESTPLYSVNDAEVMAEFAEIPGTPGSLGNPRIAVAQRKALAVKISKTMQDRNQIDRVNTHIQQVRNRMVRTWDTAMVTTAIFGNASVPSFAASGLWTNSATTVRNDIGVAIKTVALAAPTTSQGADYFGFQANTIVMNTGLLDAFIGNAQMNMFQSSPLAAELPAYTGQLPNTLLGLNVLYSPNVPLQSVLVCERNTIGAYSDERPLSATPLYGEGGDSPNGGPRETWRSDVTRATVIAIDQPLAGVIITGVHS